MYGFGIRLIAITAVVLCLFCSCEERSPQRIPKTSSSVPEKSQAAPINKHLAPLPLSAQEAQLKNGRALFPFVADSVHDDEINEIIRNKFNAFAVEYQDRINSMDFTVTYNDHGILSFVMSAYCDDGGLTRYVPVNINVAGGTEITLDMLFDPNSGSYGELLAYYVNFLIDAKNMKTFSTINSVTDKEFYLTNNKLMIVFELYEIAGYSEGIPVFDIPYNVLQEHVSETGAIAVISEYSTASADNS